MKKINILFCFILFAFCLSSFSFAQPIEISDLAAENRTNRIESQIEDLVQSHKYKLGILRIMPSLTATSGYDSNAAVLHDDEIGDYYFLAVPAGSFGFKLGRRAYLRLIEELSFVYYKNLENRRDIYPATRAIFLTGGRRLLVKIDGGYLQSKYPLDEEVDVPVDQEITDAGFEVEYTLTTRIDLRSGIDYISTNLQFDQEVNDLPYQLVDRRSVFMRAGLDYHLKRTVGLTGDYVVGRSKAIDTDEITDFWSILGGLQFSSRRLVGNARVGFGRSDSNQNEPRDNFLVSVGLDFILGKRSQVGVFARREYEFSSFVSNEVLLTTEGGVRTSVPVSERVWINGSYTIGKHDYDNNVIDGVVITKDNFQNLDLSVNVRIIHNLSLRAGGRYIRRDTDIPGLEKEQVIYGFGLVYSLN